MPGTVRVYADRRKIQQVLYNLIDNAVKFSENGSSVTVEVTLKNEKAFISVKDHGVGIPQKRSEQNMGAFLQIRPLPR